MTRALALLLFVGTVAAAAPPATVGGRLPALPGPSPRTHRGRVQGIGRISGTRACEGCHSDIAAEWQASLHRQAFTDPVFLSAYAVEPLAFCRGCHAPEANAAREPDKRSAAIGVACTTCHVEDHRIVGAPADRPGKEDAAHPVFADARLATAAACSGCHQFDFPKEAMQRFPEAMQDTAHEHARSGHAKEPCQSCHMPLVDGVGEGRHKSHVFAVISDPAMIRRAARVQAVRLDGATTEITIEAADVGHSFPTGDMFRRLEVRAEALDERGQVIARARPVVLGRTFRDVPRNPIGGDFTMQRVAGSDSRVSRPGIERVEGVDGTPRASRIALTLAEPLPDATIRWSVVYQRMSSPMAEAFHVSQVLDEIVVAEGVLAKAGVVVRSGIEIGQRTVEKDTRVIAKED